MLWRKQTDSHRNKHLIVLILYFAGLLILTDSGLAKSFPFRALSVGKPVPEAKFVGYKGEEAKSISSYAGKPLLLALWGGDLAAKKTRCQDSQGSSGIGDLPEGKRGFCSGC